MVVGGDMITLVDEVLSVTVLPKQQLLPPNCQSEAYP
jgi:hypothetical protein